MPQLIETDAMGTGSLDECVDCLASTAFDPANATSVAVTARSLRRLTNNRSFLGNLLIDQLKSRHKDAAIESGYGPQAIILSPRRGNVFIRANIWPSQSDHCFQASGARTFVYGVPHDHNFSFMTSGYFGPGYNSDYFEYDYGDVLGLPGEQPNLRFVERSQLSQGKMMLYRAHIDIHNQIPPESLSVSLNIMHVDDMQGWFDQYGFDLDKGAITKVLSPNSSEVFMRTAIATRHPNALDLAQEFGKSHPSDTMRLATFQARAKLLGDPADRDALWREAELTGNAMLAACAAKERARVAEA